MTTFRIIMAILSFFGMQFLAYQMDKNNGKDRVLDTLCVGGIAVCGIILGLCAGLLISQ